MNDVRTRMRGGEQCGRGEKREEREVCAGHRPVAALQTALLCCVATGNPSLDQVFLSLSLFFPALSLSLSVTRYYELEGTKGHYTVYSYTVYIFIHITASENPYDKRSVCL